MPPLFWPWDYFDTCMGNVVALDLCLKWTLERHAWQFIIVGLLILALGIYIQARRDRRSRWTS